MHRVVASEKGRNHTVVACGSASGYILPPMIVFPRVRVSEALKASAPPGSIVAAQKKGWITAELYLRWFRFFLEQIPPARPVLLIQDGCSSHISIELIELAKENHVHLLCLPSHTTHVLQPLDVGVFSSFKHQVGLALNRLLRSSEGRVPTSEDIPAILSEAWPKSVTPVNIMSGFRKSGIHPLNPSYIHDRAFAPSIATCPFERSESPVPSESLTEGSDITVEDGANMTEDNPAESVDSLETHAVSSKSPTSSLSSAMESLCLKPKLTRKTKRKVKPSYNSVAVCITEDDFVAKYKHDKEQKKKEKEKKQPTRGRKKQASTRPTKSTSAVTASTRPKSTRSKSTREQSATAQLTSATRVSTRSQSRSTTSSKTTATTKSVAAQLTSTTTRVSTRSQSRSTATSISTTQSVPVQVTSTTTTVSTRSQSRSIAPSTLSKTTSQSAASARTQSPDSLNSESESDCECAVCGEHYSDRSATWVQCNSCVDWFDLDCAGISNEQLQDEYLCDVCAEC